MQQQTLNTFYMKPLLLGLFLACCIFTGCKKKDAEKVSKEEAIAFAHTIEKQVEDFKIDFIEKNVHFPTLMDRIYLNENSKKLKGIEAGMKKNLSSNNYEKAIYDIMGGAGSFEMTKQYENNGLQHAIFRIQGVNGFNYIDMEFTKQDKKIWIADMFLFNNGENLSKSMGDLAEKLLAHEGTAIEKDLVTNMDRIKKYMRDGEYENARTVYLRLPYNLRNNKLYEGVYLEILSKINQEEYLAELEKITQKYESKDGYSLMLLDVYLAKKDFAKALSCIDVIDSTVKHDPFLDYYRGLVSNMNNDKEKAIGYFQKVTVNMPDFADNYAELFAHYSAINDKENAKKYYTIYKTLKGKSSDVMNFYETQYPYLSE